MDEADAQAKEKADITRVTAQASEKAKAETKERVRATVRVWVRVRDNASNISVVEAATEIRDGAESEVAERDRA